MTGTNPLLLLQHLNGDAPEADSSGTSEAETERKPTQADRLVSLATSRKVELFHAPGGERYARIPVDGHVETWQLNTASFRDWLAHQYWKEYESVPSAQATQNAPATLGGKARFEGDECDVHVRLAIGDSRIYLDHGDPAWQVTEITARGWTTRAAADVPVRFRRPKTLLSLPMPERGGSLGMFRPFVNVATDRDFMLIVGWLIGLFQLHGGRAILEIIGEQGTAKTSLARLLRMIVDPCTVPLGGLPRDERDLMIRAQNGALVAIDNVSLLKDWLSDAMCRLSTGGGVSGRQLYTDGDEHAINAQRSILMTGINRVAQRGDLLDRDMAITLEPISSRKRQTESTLTTAFETAHPTILGAVLDAVAVALANYQTTIVANPPRLADFVTWVEAASSALGWNPGDFAAAFDQTRQDADEAAIEAFPIGPAILALVRDHDGPWEGKASELLAALVAVVSDETRRDPDWPKRANTLSGQLRRLAPNLRRVGVRVDQKRTNEGRIYTIQKTSEKDRHYRHHRHAGAENSHESGETADDDHGDDDRPASSLHRHGPSPSSPEKADEHGESDDSDDGDDELPPLSISELGDDHPGSDDGSFPDDDPYADMYEVV